MCVIAIYIVTLCYLLFNVYVDGLNWWLLLEAPVWFLLVAAWFLPASMSRNTGLLGLSIVFWVVYVAPTVVLGLGIGVPGLSLIWFGFWGVILIGRLINGPLPEEPTVRR
jgi:hypothetical protein